MAKRRTKSQKEKAKHSFTVSWKPTNSSRIEAKKGYFEAGVNRQKNFEPSSTTSPAQQNNIPVYSGQIVGLASIKKDIRKSLILAALILASEVMIYLIWF